MIFFTLLFATVAPVCCSKWCMQWNLNYKLRKLCHAIYEHSLTVLVISIRNSLLFLESKALEVGLVKCKVCDLQLPIRKLNVEWNRPPHTIYWQHLVKSWIFIFEKSWVPHWRFFGKFWLMSGSSLAWNSTNKCKSKMSLWLVSKFPFSLPTMLRKPGTLSILEFWKSQIIN